MWTGGKGRGSGTAIGVVQDQLSPLLWVALYLPQNPKTRSNTEIAIKIAADGFTPNKKNATREWRPSVTAVGVQQPRVRQSSSEPSCQFCPAHFEPAHKAQ